MTENNLKFAFHHFDTDGTGVITSANLEECFRREGKHKSQEEIDTILAEVRPATPGQITFEEYCNYMQTLLCESPTHFRSR